MSADRFALALVEGARLERDRAEATFRRRIVEAVDRGVSLRDVGEAAGLSHVRVLQITREAIVRDAR
jgi:hypothetical protein